MLTPKVNINGTSREELIRQRLDARSKIRDTITALYEMQPHGRDYLGDTETYNRDRATNAERIEYLERLFDVLEEEALAIQNS